MRPHRGYPSARARAVIGAACAMIALAGCASAAAQSSWVDQPSQTQEPGAGPGITLPLQSEAAGGPSTPGPTGSSAGNGPDPSVVATGLSAPTGLALLPDGTALVGERTTGRILQVQPRAGQPVKVIRTLSGLSTTGGGGLLDLAVSPDYQDDGLIYAYVTTPAGNQIVEFTLTGPVTTVLGGIPRGPVDNTGRLVFDADGNLFLATSDAGNPAGAAVSTVLSGKVLHVDSIGHPVTGTSAVYASGVHLAAGLCVDPTTGRGVEIDSHGTVELLSAGADYGWPAATSDTAKPLATVPAKFGTVGGCAIADGQLYVAGLDDTALLDAPITTGTAPTVGAFAELLKGKYGRLLTVVAAPDGALWLTTSNKDGHGKPVAADERVIRIVLSGGASSPKA